MSCLQVGPKGGILKPKKNADTSLDRQLWVTVVGGANKSGVKRKKPLQLQQEEYSGPSPLAMNPQLNVESCDAFEKKMLSSPL